jgi:hypothetical protein
MRGINNGTKELTGGYQNCNTSQILIFGGYVNGNESLYTLVIIWVNTIVNHIDTRAYCLGMNVLHNI